MIDYEKIIREDCFWTLATSLYTENKISIRAYKKLINHWEKQTDNRTPEEDKFVNGLYKEAETVINELLIVQ